MTSQVQGGTMAKKRALRWQDMDYSDEPVLAITVGAQSSKTTGPTPEFLAKKAAEQAPKTAEWYGDSLGQLWEFLEAQGLVTIGRIAPA